MSDAELDRVTAGEGLRHFSDPQCSINGQCNGSTNDVGGPIDNGRGNADNPKAAIFFPGQ